MSGFCISCRNIPREGQSSLSYSSITTRGSLTVLKGQGRGCGEKVTVGGHLSWVCDTMGVEEELDLPGMLHDGRPYRLQLLLPLVYCEIQTIDYLQDGNA